MSIFQEPITPPTPEERVAMQIDEALRQAANAMKSSYLIIRNLIYNNPNFKTNEQSDGSFEVDSNAIYIAFATYTTTGLTPDDLGKSARLIKASLNQFAPETIVDEVPEATINFNIEVQS